MKKCLVMLLAALLITPLALAEESFFAEEFFDPSDSAGEETFFEESGFFAENDFFGDVTETTTLPEEEALTEQKGETEETGTESRTLIWNALDNIPTVVPLNEPWRSPITFTADPFISSKANQIKLSWTHTDYNTGKAVKLPKNVKYIVYEGNTDDPTVSARWLEVGRTRSKSITLKNRTAGRHSYLVRAEEINKNAERYGQAQTVSAEITASNLWKTISSITARQVTVDSGADAGQWLYFRFSVPEYSCVTYPSFEQTSGADRFRVTLTCSNGEIFSQPFVPWDIDYFYNPSLTEQPFPFTETVTAGKSSFVTPEMRIKIPIDKKNAKNFVLKITPLRNDVPAKAKTFKLKKLQLDDPAWTIAPVILEAKQFSPFSILLRWVHDCGDTTPECFEIYDGKNLIDSVIPERVKTTTSSGITCYERELPLSASGKHKLTVRASTYDRKRRGPASAAHTLVIPVPEKSIPIIDPELVTFSSGHISLVWVNTNPLIDYFRICITPGNSPLTHEGKEPETVEIWSPSANSSYVDRFFDNFSVPAADSYAVVVQGVTADGRIFTSDALYVAYNSPHEIIQIDGLKR